jgi:hypothetical protein
MNKRIKGKKPFYRDLLAEVSEGFSEEEDNLVEG